MWYAFLIPKMDTIFYIIVFFKGYTASGELSPRVKKRYSTFGVEIPTEAHIPTECFP